MIALDFGLKKMGLAWYFNGIIIPLEPLIRKNRIEAAKNLQDILEQKKAIKLIIGIANEEMQKRIEHFIKLLDFNGEIIFIDETLSSKEAQNKLDNRTNNKKNAKNRFILKNGFLDSVAAMIIMERYLKEYKKY